MNVRGRQERGAALVLALLLIIILGIGAAASWRHMHVTLKRGETVANDEAALQLADAGVNRAAAMLSADPAYRGEERTPLGDGFYTVTVRPLADGRYVAEARGTLEDGGVVRGACGVTAELARLPEGGVRVLRWTEQRRVDP